MKHLLIFFYFVPVLASAQFTATGNNIFVPQSERYVRLSPTDNPGNRRVILAEKDSTYMKVQSHNFSVNQLNVDSTKSLLPNNIMWANDSGRLYKTSYSSFISDLNARYFAKPSGAADQYLNGLGFPNNFKRVLTYAGTTNASGLYTVTYSTAFPATPNVQPVVITNDPRRVVMLTTSSTTGFTILVQDRVDVLGLLPTYSNVNGANITVLVYER